MSRYVEPHIEQGPVLEAMGVPLGFGTGMQGKRTFRVRVTGEAAHAGTTPRANRRDALLAAATDLSNCDAVYPCRGGITHNPREAIEPAHATVATQVLAVWLAEETGEARKAA